MEDNTLDIHNNKINVEAIMATIRENIRRGKAAGELLQYPDTQISTVSSVNTESEWNEAFQRDLAYINANWDLHNNRYSIRSHRPYIGKILVKGRQLVHGEVRRYVDPMVSWQTEFNASTVRIINRTAQQCATLDQRQQELKEAFSSFKLESENRIANCVTTAKNDLDLKTESLSDELSAIKENLDLKIESTSNELSAIKENLDVAIEQSLKERYIRMDVDLKTRTWLSHVLEGRIEKGLSQKSALLAPAAKDDLNYLLFEERFRGSREDISQRQRAFLPYFEKCSRVLDIGCGRGEFLEILRDQGVRGIGVDSDPDMVAFCRSRQLEVEQSDAITYLERLEDRSLDGIFIDQVIEHLEPQYLVQLLARCYQKMKSGHIVVETVNPLSYTSFVNFYIDMTHTRPVHPDTLQYLLGSVGFQLAEKKFFSPVSDECRLRTMEEPAGIQEHERNNVEVYNHNIEMLNTVLFGAQDYAIIAKK